MDNRRKTQGKSGKEKRRNKHQKKTLKRTENGAELFEAREVVILALLKQHHGWGIGRGGAVGRAVGRAVSGEGARVT